MFYQVVRPVRAILHRPGRDEVSVTIPAGAVLTRCGHTRALLGMVEVRWLTREYSVLDRDLERKCVSVQPVPQSGLNFDFVVRDASPSYPTLYTAQGHRKRPGGA
jgi:hypothetical protein